MDTIEKKKEKIIIVIEGLSGEICRITTLHNYSTIIDVKFKIEDDLNINVYSQCLIHNYNNIYNNYTILSNLFENNNTYNILYLNLIIRSDTATQILIDLNRFNTKDFINTLDQEYINDISFMATAIQIYPYILTNYNSKKIKLNKELIILGILTDYEIFISLDNIFKEDYDIIIIAIEYSPFILGELLDIYKADKQIVKLAVSIFGDSLIYASDELKDDKEIVSIAASKIGFSLEYVSDRLKADKDIVKIAVNNNSGYSGLKYASTELKADKELVELAVQYSGYELAHASINLRDDYDIVRKAVEQDGFAIYYASNRLQANIEIVKLAIVNDCYGEFLINTSDSIKNDKEFPLFGE